MNNNIENFDNSSPIIKKFLYHMLTIKGRSQNTVYSYYSDLKLFFRFLKIYYKIEKKENFDNISISDIDVDFIKKININDVYEFLFFSSNIRNNESKSRARKVSCIKSFFKFITYSEKLLDENPVDALESPKIKKTLPKYLNLDQSINLLQAVDGCHKERDICIITLFLNCGMRLSELVAINVDDIVNNPITITGKGNKERQIYLNSATLEAIEEYMKVRETLETSSPALFLSQKNTRLSARRIQKIVEDNLKKSGIDGFSVHKLRHTAATLMFQYGSVDVRTLQEILGHESLATTQIYTHVSNSQVKEAFESNPLAKIKVKKNNNNN